jgi:hypothetical protein
MLRQVEQAPGQHQALAHVHDVVTFGGVKTDLAVVPFEHGAPPRPGRHDHRFQHLGGDTGAFQGGGNGITLARAIGILCQVLQRTTATGAEVDAD